MSDLTRRTALSLPGATLIAAAGQSRSAPPNDALPVAATAQIDALFADCAGQNAPGYGLGVFRAGRAVLARGYGLANLDDAIPITGRTVFHLASLSKQFTASAIALLVLDGRLSLDEPVSAHLPEVAKFGPGLKVKHLVYMTSGLHEYTDVARKAGLPWFSFFYFTRDDAISAALSPDTLLFAPGSQWAYSNTNYMLLTLIVERVSGQSFADFMSARVFKPLGMDATLIDDDTTRIVPHRAVGYAPRSDRLIAETASIGLHLRPGPGYARLTRVSPHFGGSGVLSSLEDLARWDANWYDERLAGPAFTALMNRREKFQHDKDNDALGLVFGSYGARETIWYSGADLDASSYMVRLPQSRLTVVCLSNNPVGDAESRAMKVLGVLDRTAQL